MTNLYKILSLFTTLLFIVSCDKERLTKEKEILVGTWNWQYTDSYHYCDGFLQNFSVNPEMEGQTYQIEFLKKGVIRFYKNENLLSEHNIVFDYAHISEQGIVESNREVEANLYLDGDEDKSLYISGTPKEMRFNYFPYESTGECNIYYYNFFEKEY